MIRKTGILGGTFDPVHNGHLALAEAAGKLCSLDEILLLPAAVPPHKQQAISSFSDRVAMLEIAVSNRTTLSLSTIEQSLPTPSYTIDTLRYLLSHSPCPMDLFFITGADAFLDLLSWKEYQALLATVHFIVFSRKGSDIEELYKFFEQVGYLRRKGIWYSSTSQKRIYCSPVTPPAVSSSEIRQRVAKGLSIRKLVPDGVEEYIKQNNIYSSQQILSAH